MYTNLYQPLYVRRNRINNLLFILFYLPLECFSDFHNIHRLRLKRNKESFVKIRVLSFFPGYYKVGRNSISEDWRNLIAEKTK